MARLPEDKMKILRLLSNKFVLDCISRISEEEARFKELDVIPNERMRSIRLSELEEFGLIERVGRKKKGKIISVYRITKYGDWVLKHIREMTENGLF